MSQDEEQQRRSRVVVETPTSRREEVSYSHTERVPERSSYSTGMVAAVALTAIALTAFVLFFLMNNDDPTNTNVRVTTAPTPIPTAPTPLVIQQPAQQQAPPIIIEQQAPATAPAPVIIQAPPASSAPPPSTTATTAPSSSGVTDATIESDVNKALTDDPDLSALGITVTVIDGKATLIGNVQSAAQKSRAERLARNISGVRKVDSKLTVEP